MGKKFLFFLKKMIIFSSEKGGHQISRFAEFKYYIQNHILVRIGDLTRPTGKVSCWHSLQYEMFDLSLSEL